jgi:hypothetical protein
MELSLDEGDDRDNGGEGPLPGERPRLLNFLRKLEDLLAQNESSSAREVGAVAVELDR